MASKAVQPVNEKSGARQPARFISLVGSRQGWLALLATVLVLGAAIGLALLTGPGTGPITGGVESASSASAQLLGSLSGILPVGYAVGAGMVAAVNPCGFAMLPSYLGLYLGTADGSEGGDHLGKRFLRGLRISGTVSASFVVLFGIAGIALSLASAVIAKSFPWIGLAVGFMLVFGGGRMLAGGTLYASFGDRMADRMRGGVRQPGLRGYFAYGLAYGLASLSCTLPIFLAVVGSALAVNGLLAGMVQFVLYAAGMGLVISALTLGVALFKHAALGGVRRVLPFVQPLSALLLLVAGAYIIYYWLTLGGLLRSIRL
jgi:cytochrome c biogenesis protein CcdA